jgi:6-phosphogluconolactonase
MLTGVFISFEEFEMTNQFKLTVLSVSIALILPNVSFAASKAPVEIIDTVYTLSNNIDNNEVIAFQRDSVGNMAATGRFATGGKGTGGGLGNQGALEISQDGNYLFAVNPGSNEVSVFSIKKGGELTLLDRAFDQGLTPVSVTVDHNRVFVVNAGDDTIFGYQFNRKLGKLEPLPLSHKRLSDSRTGPAQISFDKEGETLVVTEKATNKITTFVIDEDGNTPADGVSFKSAGQTPFGFYINKRNRLIVSEANGGALGASSVSAYQIKEDGTLQLVNTAAATGQAAACWIVTTPNGRIAYTTNTRSGTVSSFTVKSDGTLTLLQAVAASEGGATDMAMSNDGKVLYVLSQATHTVGVYNIDKNGALAKTTTLTGLPVGDTGLVVR